MGKGLAPGGSGVWKRGGGAGMGKMLAPGGSWLWGQRASRRSLDLGACPGAWVGLPLNMPNHPPAHRLVEAAWRCARCRAPSPRHGKWSHSRRRSVRPAAARRRPCGRQLPPGSVTNLAAMHREHTRWQLELLQATSSRKPESAGGLRAALCDERPSAKHGPRCRGDRRRQWVSSAARACLPFSLRTSTSTSSPASAASSHALQGPHRIALAHHRMAPGLVPGVTVTAVIRGCNPARAGSDQALLIKAGQSRGRRLR